MSTETSVWRSLTALPRPGPDDWRGAPLLVRWLIATRAAVYPLTAFACLFAGLVARPLDHPLLFGIASLGVLLAHATNNLINDHVDYLKGLDRGNYFRNRSGVQPLEAGLMSVAEHRRYILFTGAAAGACGVAVYLELGWPVLLPMAAGGFFVVFYTYPLKWVGLGEIAVWLVWGPLMVGALAFVATGGLSGDVLWLGALYGLGPLGVILGKHTDKIDDDVARGVTTLPTLLGERHARLALAAVAAGVPVGGIAWAVAAGQPAYLLLVLIVPLWVSLYGRGPVRGEVVADGVPLHHAVIAFRFSFVAGLLLVVSAAVSRWI